MSSDGVAGYPVEAWRDTFRVMMVMMMLAVIAAFGTGAFGTKLTCIVRSGYKCSVGLPTARWDVHVFICKFTVLKGMLLQNIRDCKSVQNQHTC